MKANDNFVLRSIAGENLLIPVGDAAVEVRGMITLNAPAVLIWENLQKGAEYDALLAALLDAFEVDEATAKRDLDELLDNMKKIGVITD